MRRGEVGRGGVLRDESDREEKIITDEGVQAFLDYAHDIDLGDIQPNPHLPQMLQKVNCRRWVFSASAPDHVERCLKILGIRDLFEGVIAASSVDMFKRVGHWNLNPNINP